MLVHFYICIFAYLWLPHPWAGIVSGWQRSRKRKSGLTWRTWRRRSASVWELRLAIQQFLRWGAFSLMLLFQLWVLSHCQPCPLFLPILNPPTSGFLRSPPHLSTHLHLVAWCLDTSGWFVAPVILGVVSSCHNCPRWSLNFVFFVSYDYVWLHDLLISNWFIDTEHCIFILNKCSKKKYLYVVGGKFSWKLKCFLS